MKVSLRSEFVSQVIDDNTGANVYIRAHGVVLYVPSE